MCQAWAVAVYCALTHPVAFPVEALMMILSSLLTPATDPATPQPPILDPLNVTDFLTHPRPPTGPLSWAPPPSEVTTSSIPQSGVIFPFLMPSILYGGFIGMLLTPDASFSPGLGLSRAHLPTPPSLYPTVDCLSRSSINIPESIILPHHTCTTC